MKSCTAVGLLVGQIAGCTTDNPTSRGTHPPVDSSVPVAPAAPVGDAEGMLPATALDAGNAPAPVPLAAGESEVTLEYTAPDAGQTDSPTMLEVRSDEATLVYDPICPARWGLWIPLSSPAFAYSVAAFFWFQDTEAPAGQVLAGEMTAVAVGIAEIEHGGAVFEDMGEMRISESSPTTVSGSWSGDVSVEVAFNGQATMPSGEVFRLLGVRFHQVPRDQPTEELREALWNCSLPDASVPAAPTANLPVDASPADACNLGWPSDQSGSEARGVEECLATYGDLCFESADIACHCANCETCFVFESLPALVECVE